MSYKPKNKLYQPKVRIIDLADGSFRVVWTKRGLQFAKTFESKEAARTFAEFKKAGGVTVA